MPVSSNAGNFCPRIYALYFGRKVDKCAQIYWESKFNLLVELYFGSILLYLANTNPSFVCNWITVS
jgi:hypothetical protein